MVDFRLAPFSTRDGGARKMSALKFPCGACGINCVRHDISSVSSDACYFLCWFSRKQPQSRAHYQVGLGRQRRNTLGPYTNIRIVERRPELMRFGLYKEILTFLWYRGVIIIKKCCEL